MLICSMFRLEPITEKATRWIQMTNKRDFNLYRSYSPNMINPISIFQPLLKLSRKKWKSFIMRMPKLCKNFATLIQMEPMSRISSP